MATCEERYFHEGDTEDTKGFIKKLMELTLSHGSPEHKLHHTPDGYAFEISKEEWMKHKPALHDRVFNGYVLRFRRIVEGKIPIARFYVID
jgi:hypothetical protein